jgi:hypothetical protein
MMINKVCARILTIRSGEDTLGVSGTGVEKDSCLISGEKGAVLTVEGALGRGGFAGTLGFGLLAGLNSRIN